MSIGARHHGGSPSPFRLNRLWTFALAALVLAGCQQAAARPAAQVQAPGPAQAPAPPTTTDVSMRFAWFNVGTHAPYFLPLATGEYERQKLAVTLLEGSGGDMSAKLVANGSQQFGTTDAGVALRAISQGMPIKVVAANYRTHGMAVMSPKEKPLKTPADLVGKNIAVPTGTSQWQLFPAFLAVNRIPEDRVNVVSVDVQTAPTVMKTGQADGYAAWWTTSPPVIDGTADYLAWSDFGFTSLSDVTIAYVPFLEQNPDAVRRFLTVVQKAWMDSAKNPEAAVDAQMSHTEERFPRTVVSPAFQNSLSLVDGRNTMGKPWGLMTEADWQATKDLLVQYGGLDASVDLSKVWTNDYLPQS